MNALLMSIQYSMLCTHYESNTHVSRTLLIIGIHLKPKYMHHIVKFIYMSTTLVTLDTSAVDY